MSVSLHMPPRLGRNHGGYHGETIRIPDVIASLKATALNHGWSVSALPFGEGDELLALQRTRPSAHRHVYVSAGIHGDEPAGPLALLQLLSANRWPDDTNLFLCPCLNPTGFPLNRRENASGTDLNRDYKHLTAAETRTHTAWLKTLPDFAFALCLHEDWEANGFYLYELNPDERTSRAQPMIAAVAQVCPIDLADVIEGRSARGGVIHPSADPNSRPQWPEAFWLGQNKTRHSYTLEAPSDFPLATRVAALVAAVNAALR